MVRTHAVWIGIILWAVFECGQATGQQKVIAEGDWSKPVADTRGYAVRGRLVLCEKSRSDDGREVAVYVELQDASEFSGGSMRIFCDLGKTDFRPEYKGGLQCELVDKDKKPVPATSYPFGGGGGGVPASDWITLPADATIRLRASPFGIRQARAMAISPQLSQLWVIGDDDHNEYVLSGTFTVDPDAGRKTIEDPHIWRGTLVLPAVRIVQPEQLELHNEWVGELDDRKLTELVSAKGYITSEAEWKKLWTAWRPTEEVPMIDFTRHLVLIGFRGNS